LNEIVTATPLPGVDLIDSLVLAFFFE